MMTRSLLMLPLIAMLAGCGGEEAGPTPIEITPVVAVGAGESRETEITIESWQFDSLEIWTDGVLPAFEAAQPEVAATYLPVRSNDYESEVAERFAEGGESDIVGCFAYDMTADLSDAGYLLPLDDVAETDRIDDRALDAFRSSDRDILGCLPLAAVMHGIYYNADLLAEYGFGEPATLDEFFAQAEAIAAAGTHVAIGLNGADHRHLLEAYTVLFGAAAWGGETMRDGLRSGEIALDSTEFVAGLELLERARGLVPVGLDEFDLMNARDLFVNGGAVFYPGGSWEGSPIAQSVDFTVGLMGVPPVEPGGECTALLHPDIGLGVSARSDEPEAALDLIDFAQTEEFREAWTSKRSGFFWFDQAAAPPTEPLMVEFTRLRDECDTSARVFAGYPNALGLTFASLLGDYGAEILLNDLDASEAAAAIATEMHAASSQDQ